MSDTSGVDNDDEVVAPSTPVAPPKEGDTPGSTPAPVDPTAPTEAEPKPEEEAERQSRREARAFATLRRENRELYRRLGGLEAMLQQQQPQPAEGNPQPTRSPPVVNEAQDELNRSILEKIEDEGKEYEAVVEKITAPTFPISVAMRDYLATSKNAAPVAKFIADNPGEARRISLLGERAADRAMEQIETGLSGPKPAPRTTRAPAPVRTVGGSSSARHDPSKMSMDEYAEWRLKRL